MITCAAWRHWRLHDRPTAWLAAGLPAGVRAAGQAAPVIKQHAIEEVKMESDEPPAKRARADDPAQPATAPVAATAAIKNEGVSAAAAASQRPRGAEAASPRPAPPGLPSMIQVSATVAQGQRLVSPTASDPRPPARYLPGWSTLALL